MARRSLALIGIACSTLLFSSPRYLRRYFATNRGSGKYVQARMRGAEFVGDSGVVLQQTASDCGAAALSMALAAFGVDKSRASLVRELHTGPDGTTLLDLRTTAGRAGVPARSWRLRASDISHVPLPVIAWVGGNHFVLIRRRIDAVQLEVDDPAIGRLIWPVSAFVHSWSGETLVFRPMWVPPTA